MLRWPIKQTLLTSYSGPNCKGEVAAHNSELPGTRSRQVLTHHSRSFTIKNSDITQGLDHGSSIYFNRLFGNEYNDLLQAWCMLENLWQLEGVGGLCFWVTETNFMESSSVLPPPPPNFYPVMELCLFPIQHFKCNCRKPSAHKHTGDHRGTTSSFLCLHLEFPFAQAEYVSQLDCFMGGKLSSLQSCLNTSRTIRFPNTLFVCFLNWLLKSKHWCSHCKHIVKLKPAAPGRKDTMQKRWGCKTSFC